MRSFFQDLRYAVRSLRKSPGFTVVALLILGLGIGANTAIFSFVRGVFLRALPYDHPESIVRLRERQPDGADNATSAPTFLEWQRQGTAFTVMAANTGASVTLTGRTEPVRVWGWKVSARYFDVFGVKPLLGRAFADGEDRPGREQVAVLSHRFWQASFGGDASIIGRAVLLDGEPCMIVGVLPPGNAFAGDVWRPLVLNPGANQDYRWLEAYARLKPGVSLSQARAQMSGIAAQLAREHPQTSRGWSVRVEPLTGTLVKGSYRQSLWVLLAAVGLVFLIACSNLANLTLSRGFRREREIAIRTSLGASRTRIVRQMVTETALISTMGASLGVAVGYLGMRLLIPWMPVVTGSRIALDGLVLAYAAGLSVLSGVVCGLVPALHATRQNANLAAQTRVSRAHNRLRDLFVISQVALALLLTLGAGFTIRSFGRLQEVNLGIDPTNVVTASLPLSPKKISRASELSTYLGQLSDRIRSVPGVREVAFTSALPLRGWGYDLQFRIAGNEGSDASRRPHAAFKIVTPSYFRALGISLVQGRLFEATDRRSSLPVAVINATMVRKYFGTDNPIGRQIMVQDLVLGKSELGPVVAREVVGIIADEKIERQVEAVNPPAIYVPQDQCPQLSQDLVVRGDLDPLTLVQSIRAAVREVDPDQPLPFVKTIPQLRADGMGDRPLRSVLLILFASLALFLASVGIYSVVSFAVGQRTREIGIRSALGATPANIVGLIVGHGFRLVIWGLLIGSAAALGLLQLLRALLYGVPVHDPLTWIGAVAILGGVALLSCAIPARRAAAISPAVTLRSE